MRRKIAASHILLLILLPVLASSSSLRPGDAPAGERISSYNSGFKNNLVSVKGRVLDETGQALPGVTVLEKGTVNGVITDANGSYSLSVASQQAILIFKSIGYISKEIAVNDQAVLNVVLAEDLKALNEVVVIGYGTQQKKDLTGSVSSVRMKDVTSLPVPDIGQAIQGRASGVQVVSSGAPGSNVAIRIRGISTIGNSDPLLVIDGVPTDVPLNTLNPDDIASIDILKDASAAAIYGSRGASGVVLITTKRGVSGKGHLDFKAFTGVQSATDMVDMLNASQFAALHNDMMSNNGQALNPAYADPASLSNTNWLNEYFRTAPIQNYSLAYSGGTENNKYYVSGTYLNQEGIVINNSYKRYTVQFNSDSKPFSWLKFGNNLTLNHDDKSGGNINIRNAMAALPGQPVYNADGTWAGPEGQSSWYGDVRNPIGEATINDNRTAGYNILGNINAEISVLPQLKFKTTGGVQASFWDSRNWSPKYNWKPISQPFSTLNQQYNKSLTWLFDNYLTYDTTFNAKHHLVLLGGTSAQDNRYDQINASKANFISDGAQQLDNGTLLPTAGGNASDWALLSFIGRANYSYDDKYLLTATVRRDGSSRFGENNRWGWFPSGSVKWRISNEDFFNKTTWLDDLALRAGFGITGNQNIGNYAYASRLSTNQYVFNDQIVNTVVPTVLPNPDVRWEEVQQSNLGLDASLYNGRINLTVDAYLKNTTGMLVPMSVPITTGYSDIFVPEINAGKVRNKGVEINLSSQNLIGSFDWNTNFNVSYNKNEVISLNGDVPLYGGSVVNQNTNIQKNGFPIGAFYGVITNGIFQTQEDVNNYAIQQQGADQNNATSIGDLKFLDLNNDGRIDDADRTYLGNPSPRFTFAMNNSFAWRRIDLSVFLQGVEGNDIFNANRIFQEGMSVAQNQTTAVLNRWTPQNTGTSIPRAVFNDPNKNTRPSNRFIEDGSYLRIKNVTLGYTVPARLMSKAGLSTARIYISGQNLLTMTKYTGFDPEVSLNGIDMSVYPVSRTISAGINLNF